MVESELFTKGLETRRQVLGAKYVDANLAGSADFMMTFQHAVTELAWGYAWSRPGLGSRGLLRRCSGGRMRATKLW
jgi:4-carboxymuconolactone decarboxylase